MKGSGVRVPPVGFSGLQGLSESPPFSSGAISKTVNLSQSATVEDIAGIHTPNAEYSRPVIHASGASEPFAERLVFGDGTVMLRATAATTDGALTVFEEIPPLLDTPLHVHSREDELFYILEGEHIVQRGEMEFSVRPGDAVFLPRGVPHAQRRVVPGEGRLLVVCSPAGFEEFLRDLAAADAEGRLGPDAYAAASARAGISWL